MDDASSAQVMAMSTDNENITHVGKWSKVRLLTRMQQLTDLSLFRAQVIFARNGIPIESTFRDFPVTGAV